MDVRNAEGYPDPTAFAAIGRAAREEIERRQQVARWVEEISKTGRWGSKTLYHTREWRKVRREVLARDHFECQQCRKLGRYSEASTVHHIKMLKEYPSLALDPDNLTSLCRDCHEKEHRRENMQEKFPERW